MSAASAVRVREALAGLPFETQVLTLETDGSISRGGEAVELGVGALDVGWISRDMYADGLLPHAFAQLLRCGASWLQVFAAGLDHPAFRAVMAKGVRITKSDAQAAPIAEYVMAHVLSLLHPIDAQRALQERREWRTTPFREVADTRWTLIGYGAVGRALAARLRPFGAHLTVVRRSGAAGAAAHEVRTLAELPDLLPSSDVVVLACALNDQTRGLAGSSFFGGLKPGSILVNIARGGLVNEDALREGLAHARPAVAVLDVFAEEPPSEDSWLWSHPGVRMSAHTSNAGDGVGPRGDHLFLENLRRFHRDDPLLNEAAPAEVGL